MRTATLPAVLFVLLSGTAALAQDLEQVDLKKPITLTGSLSLSLETYSMDGMAARRQPFTWTIAGETSWNYQAPKGGIGVAYKRVDPEYRSMGAYFFQNDIEQFTLTPQIRLDSGRVSITANVGMPPTAVPWWCRCTRCRTTPCSSPCAGCPPVRTWCTPCARVGAIRPASWWRRAERGVSLDPPGTIRRRARSPPRAPAAG